MLTHIAFSYSDYRFVVVIRKVNMDDKSQEGKKPMGPKGALGYFNRSRDNMQIWIFARRGESVDAAINRVTARHGAKPDQVTRT